MQRRTIVCALMCVVAVACAVMAVHAEEAESHREGGPSYDEVELGASHTRLAILKLGPRRLPDTPERRRVTHLKGDTHHEADYHHEIQHTIDHEVDTAARLAIKNPERDARIAHEKASQAHIKRVGVAHEILKSHDRMMAAAAAPKKKSHSLVEVDSQRGRRGGGGRRPAPPRRRRGRRPAPPRRRGRGRRGRRGLGRRLIARLRRNRKLKRIARNARRAARKLRRRTRRSGRRTKRRARRVARKLKKLARRARRAQKKGLSRRTKHKLRKLLHKMKKKRRHPRRVNHKDLNRVDETESARRIRKLNAPKVGYYHEVQKGITSKAADRAARSVIDTPERAAYRAELKAMHRFKKVVSAATSGLKAHNKFKPHPAEAKTF